MRFLITGTGRSGTEYFARIIRKHGIRCGHQDVFRHDTVETRTWDWGKYEGESSFEAVPALPEIKDEGCRVALVTRHPYKVIRSWLALGVFGDDFLTAYELFAGALQRNFPYVLWHERPADRAAEFWCAWNTYAREYADLTARIEDQPEAEIFKSIIGARFDPAKAEPFGKATNSRPGDKRRVEVEELYLDPKIQERLEETAADFGYQTEHMPSRAQ